FYTTPATPEILPLPLHDALPISLPSSSGLSPATTAAAAPPDDPPALRSRFQGLFVLPKSALNVCESPANSGRFVLPKMIAPAARSEEHTSELQSRENLVCRLLLE